MSNTSKRSSVWCSCSLKGARHEDPECPYYDPKAPHVAGDSANAYLAALDK